MYELSVRGCFRFAWRTFRARPGILIGATVVLGAVNMVLRLPAQELERASHPSPALMAAVALATIAFALLVSLGKTIFFLRSHDGIAEVRLSDLWHPQGYWPYALVSVAFGLMFVFGLLLLIVPGIIAGVVFGFAPYLVADRAMAPMAALRESARITKGNRWNLVLLGLALLGINILGFCALIIGLLVTMPLSSLAVVHAYRRLSGNAGPASAEAAA